MTDEIVAWLREACHGYEVKPHAIFKKLPATNPIWPLLATNEEDLALQLEQRGHFVPLPKEPAALANVIEVSVVDHVLERLKLVPGAVGVRGGERSYPDLEIAMKTVGDAPFAVEVKVARRAKNGRQTDSRISLYTGNTFFKYPDLKWPGTLRPFGSYAGHISLLVIYTLDATSLSRVRDTEVIVHESWRLASKQRSSTTREYLGAVVDIQALREGRGEFASPDEFYKFWRAYNFKVGKVVGNQLTKLMSARSTHRGTA
jgi:hypothetical protein